MAQIENVLSSTLRAGRRTGWLATSADIFVTSGGFAWLAVATGFGVGPGAGAVAVMGTVAGPAAGGLATTAAGAVGDEKEGAGATG